MEGICPHGIKGFTHSRIKKGKLVQAALLPMDERKQTPVLRRPNWPVAFGQPKPRAAAGPVSWASNRPAGGRLSLCRPAQLAQALGQGPLTCKAAHEAAALEAATLQFQVRYLGKMVRQANSSAPSAHFV